MVSRPVLNDSTADRSASHDKAELAPFGTDPKAPELVEPHWELVIAAATD